MNDTCPQGMIGDLNDKALTALCAAFSCELNNQGLSKQNTVFSSSDILAIPHFQGKLWSFRPYVILK